MVKKPKKPKRFNADEAKLYDQLKEWWHDCLAYEFSPDVDYPHVANQWAQIREEAVARLTDRCFPGGGPENKNYFLSMIDESLGKTFIRMESYVNAIEKLSRSIELSPDAVFRRLSLVEALGLMGRWAEAARVVEEIGEPLLRTEEESAAGELLSMCLSEPELARALSAETLKMAILVCGTEAQKRFSSCRVSFEK